MDDDEMDMDMTPMIDVAFQLLIFFLLTINFKLMEGNLSSHLPKTGGISEAPPTEQLGQVDIKLEYDSSQSITTLLVDGEKVGSWPDGEEMDEGGNRKKIGQTIRRTYDTISSQSGKKEIPVKIEVIPTVPSGRAITTVDIVNEYVIQPMEKKNVKVPLKFKGAPREALMDAVQ